MATQQRSRPRRSGSSRHAGPRHVEAVLDPTWQSPYAPSAAEREVHQDVARHFTLRRKRPEMVGAAVVVLGLLVATTLSPWMAAVALVIALGVVYDVRRAVASLERRTLAAGKEVLGLFAPGGTPKDRQRLITVIDRLTATFGVDAVSASIVEDAGYNATLVPQGGGYSLLVTSAMMRDFELIEIEGVVAHLLARQRLGVLSRQSAAALVKASPQRRRELAGPGLAYRADEVAAAAIRYPLGLAGALRKCARQVVPESSFFATSAYDRWRSLWFDVASDRSAAELGDLDDAELRALALEEW